jgi:hypothetical protein
MGGAEITRAGGVKHAIWPATGANGISGPRPNMGAVDLTNNVKLLSGTYNDVVPITSHPSGGTGGAPSSEYRLAQLGNRVFISPFPGIDGSIIEYDADFVDGNGKFGRTGLALPVGVGVSQGAVGAFVAIPSGQLVGINYSFATPTNVLQNGPTNAWVMDIPAFNDARTTPCRQINITGLDANIGWNSACFYSAALQAIVLIPENKVDGHYYIIPWAFTTEAGVSFNVAAQKVIPTFKAPLTTFPQVLAGTTPAMYQNVRPWTDTNGDKYLVYQHNQQSNLVMLRYP